MKRYRVLSFDFDARATTLNQERQPDWEPHVQELWRNNQAQMHQELVDEFGSIAAPAKLQNFKDLGPAPFSIIAFHNRFFRQVRSSFVIGGYYPALTGACSLGERILNQLIRH